MTEELDFGQAQAKLLSLLDDHVRGVLANSQVAIWLTDDPQDLATLGLASLYSDDPIRSYATPSARLASAAATRFGALHQTLADAKTIQQAAQVEGLALLNGKMPGSGPFTRPEVLDLLDNAENANALIRASLWPLLGARLLPSEEA